MEQGTPMHEAVTYELRVATDKPEAVYGLDEPVTFVIRLTADRVPVPQAVVRWQITTETGTVQTGTAPLSDGEARVTARRRDPGFIRLEATVSGPQGEVAAAAAAAVAPEQITAARPAPDDFDAFWAEQKAALSAVPLEWALTPVAPGAAGVEAFDVQVAALGAPVSGYLARPAGAEPGSLPAIITFQGAGVGGGWLGTAVEWAREGFLALNINAHGIPNGQPAAYYTELAEGPLREYWLIGRESRDTFYFKGMFLRVVRAIDFIAAQPEWDGRTLVLYGTSQGGAQALAGAGLDGRVTLVVAGVTAMADLNGWLKNRPMGWPNMGPHFAHMPPAQAVRILETLRYFDVVHFAARTAADAFFTVGFLDDTCPPWTVYAAYNALPGRKAIYNDLDAGHENTPEALRRMREAVLAHAGRRRVPD